MKFKFNIEKFAGQQAGKLSYESMRTIKRRLA